jgi:hypothetical protein
MSKVRIILDPKGIAELVRDPGVVAHMLLTAETCCATAIISAPVYRRTYQKSMFAAKLRTRNGAFYGSDDTKALLMEYGSKNNKAFHTLRNAALAHRLKVVETRHR